VTIFNKMNFTRAAELGVQRGQFAKHNLERWPSCQDYLLVDVWRHQENYIDYANVDNRAQETLLRTTLRNVAPFRSSVRICRDFTSTCVKHEADGHFDVVYVDARHNYKGAMEDMVLWWPKVRKGGVLAGHDYMTAKDVADATPRQDWSVNDDGTRHKGAVKGAVNDFAATVGRQVVVAYRERIWNSWVIVK